MFVEEDLYLSCIYKDMGYKSRCKNPRKKSLQRAINIYIPVGSDEENLVNEDLILISMWLNRPNNYSEVIYRQQVLAMDSTTLIAKSMNTTATILGLVVKDKYNINHIRKRLMKKRAILFS